MSRPEEHNEAVRPLVDLLAWYREAGVDAVVGDSAVDWLDPAAHAPGAGFDWPARADAAAAAVRKTQSRHDAGQEPQPIQHAKPAAPPSPRAAATPTEGPRPAPVTARQPPARFASGAPEEAQSAARRLAASASDLTGLAQSIAAFDGCALKATAKSTVVYRGAEKARVMIIGEAPGRDEDLAGKPFVGRSGQLLDLMLDAIDLGEEDVHITNVIYWRPPGNRVPTPQETQMCRPFLERQVELVEPDAVLLLGGAAAKGVLLDVEEGIMKVRGKWRDAKFGSRGVRCMATLHPSFLLRSPHHKPLAWRDLLSLKTFLLKNE